MFFTKTPPKAPKPFVQSNQPMMQSKLPVEDDALDANYETAGRWFGLCQKNAVHSIEDFRKTVDKDPVLKAHFANFNWDNARMGRLEKVTRAYVDYRKSDMIFRKKTPIVLAAGDQYITDGVMMVRTNCCNTYNPLNELDIDPAAGPSMAPEPMAPFLSEPPVAMSAPTVHPLTQNPMTSPTSTTGGNPPIPLPPPVIPPPGYDPPSTPSGPKTPIPAAFWMLGTGLAVLIGLRKKIKK